MDNARRGRREVRDLKAAGADVIQLDEPWLQARPEEARRLALPAIDAALDGIPGPTALHLCFGYVYVARDKPNGYSFLPELTASKVEQISIEAAQPHLDLATLDGLGDKTVNFGVISMGDPQPETPETVAARIRAALIHLPLERLIQAPDCGMKYIPRETAFAKLKALAKSAAIVRRELTWRLMRLIQGQRTSMTRSPAATSTSIDANSGFSHPARAAREQFPTLSQMMVGPCGSRRRRAAKSSSLVRMAVPSPTA